MVLPLLHHVEYLRIVWGQIASEFIKRRRPASRLSLDPISPTLTMAFETPPPYTIAASASTYGSIFGFPLGYFVIRSLATGRVLDVDANQISDGTEVVLWEEKEKSLVESLYFVCTWSMSPST